jgi:hypothetical protein
MIEPLAFFAAVMVSIWVFHGHRTPPIIVLALWVVTSWILHRQTAASLGLSLQATVRCFVRWRFLFFVLVVFAAAIAGRSLASAATLQHAVQSLVWCVVQQAVYQSMISRPLRRAIKREAVAAIISGALFALVHLPNPVLVPATFVWGVCASLLFSSCPSVVALAGLQLLLSAIGIAAFPVALHHGFRIGPGY